MNTPINDGGPAFPETRWSDVHRQDVQWQGMTLRDWFAGQALAAIFNSPKVIEEFDKVAGNIELPELVANAAYDLADNMLKAREAKTEPEPQVENTMLNSLPEGYRFMTAGELIGPGCKCWSWTLLNWCELASPCYGDQQKPTDKYICPLEPS